tara:strand:+ start:1859 stop:3022 length:1164 start_codon:yes stop_codon:yes gene_type:complete
MTSNENHSQKRKICFVVNECNFFYSHRFELAKKLTSISEVYLITDVSLTNKKLIKKIVDNNINIHPLMTRNSSKGLIGLFTYFFGLLSLINKIKPSAIFFVTLEISLFGALIGFLKKKIDFYYLITGFGPFLFGKGLKNKFLFHVYKFIFSTKKRTPNNIFIFQNIEDKNIFINLGFTSEKSTTVIHGSGINLNKYHFKKRDVNKVLSFIFASRLVKAKGIREFLIAAKIMKETYPEIKISIAGKYDPADPDKISEELFNKIKISKHAHYLGNINHDKMAETLMKSDIFVLPSYGEGLPKAALEAAALGMPLILSDVSGCKECLEDKKNGLLIKSQDVESLITAMKWIILNQHQISMMGQFSREIIEKKFSINEIFYSYKNLITRIK